MDIDFGTIIADAPEEPEFSDTACGTPGQTVLNGLPALACGTDFDARLDEHLTFYSDAITGEEVTNGKTIRVNNADLYRQS